MLIESNTLVNHDQSRSASVAYNRKKVTIYLRGMFGISAKKASLLEVGTSKYAQYDHAPFIRFVPKGKRKVHVWHGTDNPGFGLIVNGWDAPEPDDALGEADTSGHFTVRKTRYLSFAQEYVDEFNAKIDPLIESGDVEVIVDFRGTSPYEFGKE